MKLNVYKNYYFKDSEVELMSGIQLPKGADGIVRNKVFVGCTFHYNCMNVQFEDCEFEDCDRPWLD